MGKLKTYAQWRLEENLIEYNFYYKKFKKLLMIMFKWENLPDGISSRYLEETLFHDGIVIFFKSKMGFYVVCKATQIGLNNYNEPTGFHAVSDDGTINEYVKMKDCVVIYNDITRCGSVSDVNYFAKKISNVVKTIDINLENMKNPYIVETSEGQKESVKQVFRKKTNGEPYILVNEEYMKNVRASIFNLDIKDYTQSLTILKNEIINEALTYFGINNVHVQKKERLTSGETDQNNEQILLSKNTYLECRQNAVDSINKKFNLDIKLKIVDSETLKSAIGGLINE